MPDFSRYLGVAGLACSLYFGSALGSPAHAMCEPAAKQFSQALAADSTGPVLVDQIMKAAQAEIERRRAPLTLSRPKIEASVDQALSIWAESRSVPKVEEFFLKQCRSMQINWC